MRSLTLVCAGLALVGGVVSVHLWRELHAERELTSQLREEVGDLRAGAIALPRSDGIAPPRPAPEAAQPGAASQATGSPAPTAPPAVNLAQAAVDVQRLISNRGELLKDPEYRKAALAQTRLSLPQRYPGLAEELGLTAEEADRLFDLLAENQLEQSSVVMSVPLGIDGAANSAALEQANRTRQELLRQQDQQVQALLGGRYSQWQEYQDTLNGRLRVAQLDRTFATAGAPALNSEQSRPLIAAYNAEQRRQADELRRVMTTPGRAPADPQRFSEEQLRLQGESNRRLVEAAKPHLNAKQLEALQASLDQQLTMARASSRMMELQRQAQGANAGPANGIALPAVVLP